MLSLDGVVAYVEYVKRVLLDIVVKAFSLSLVVGMASFTYGAFYYLYMPTQSYQVPLEFQFEPCPPQDQNLRNIHKCSFPNASVRMPALTPGTPYSVAADFVFQSSPNSRSFMACISEDGQRDEVCKAVTLTAKTSYARFVDFVLVYPLEVVTHLVRYGSVSRASDTNQHVSVEFKSDHLVTESPSHSGGHQVVNVTLKTVAIEAISAFLQIHQTQFNALQRFMWHHPLLTETVAVIALSFVIILVSVGAWNAYTRPKSVTVTEGGGSSASVVSKQELARARLGKIDPKVVLRSLSSELIESSDRSDQISLIGVLSNFRKNSNGLSENGAAAWEKHLTQQSIDSDEGLESAAIQAIHGVHQFSGHSVTPSDPNDPDLVNTAVRKRN